MLTETQIFQARSVLSRLSAVGIAMDWSGDRLKTGRAVEQYPELLADLKAHRGECYELVTARTPPCAVCGSDGFIFDDDGRALCSVHEVMR